MSDHGQPDVHVAERLLQALAEQLKSPLLQIAYHAEAAQPDAFTEIRTASDRALRLLDSYLLSINQQQLELEPVSVSSVLYDVAHALYPLAR